MRAKETRDVVLNHFQRYMAESESLEKNGLPIPIFDKLHHVSVNIELSMIDGKMVGLLQGWSLYYTVL